MPEPGSLWRGDGRRAVRVMATADNWVMLRKPNCIPFCLHVKEFRQRFVPVRSKPTKEKE